MRLAVGGKPALFYLPLTVAERLGYFRDQGIELEISDFPGGARALQALIGGSADVVTGAYDHTIQMQAKSQPIVATIQLGRFPGYVLAVLSAKAPRYQGPKDLKGMKVEITAPGSSTHMMVQHLLVKNGLRPEDDASFIGVGASASAVAAVQRGEIDAIVNVDPVISLLESQGLIKVVADTRTLEGTREVFGRPYPAAVLYAPRPFIDKRPRTTPGAGERACTQPQMDRQPFRGGDPGPDAAGIRARQQGELSRVNQEEPADVFPRRPFHPRWSRNGSRGAARVRSGSRQRQGRPGRDLYRCVRRKGADRTKIGATEVAAGPRPPRLAWPALFLFWHR